MQNKMTAKEFLEKGYRFVYGDEYLLRGVVFTCGVDVDLELINDIDIVESKMRFVLSAKALEQEENEQQKTDSILEERGNRYGEFKDGAIIMQDLKHVMRKSNGWLNLTDAQQEALEMIQHKIGRILNGDPNYIDNWVDISGYSQLITNILESK